MRRFRENEVHGVGWYSPDYRTPRQRRRDAMEAVAGSVAIVVVALALIWIAGIVG